MVFWLKYGTQADIRFPLVKRGVVDLAVSADYTPAAADSSIYKDGGNGADTANTIAAVTQAGTRTGTLWKLTLSATEMQAAEIDVQIVDAATKAIEDQLLIIYTYGNASAKFAGSWDDLVRLGLTALPNAAANAAGGLPISAAGALDLDEMNVDIEAIQTSTAGLTFTGAGKVDASVRDINGVATTPVTTIKAVVGLTTADVVASVTGAVGSVGTGGIVAGSFGAGAIDTSAVNASAGTKIFATACTEPVAAVAASPTAIAALSWLLSLSRNKITQTATTQLLLADDNATTVATSTVSDDAVTFTRGKFA